MILSSCKRSLLYVHTDLLLTFCVKVLLKEAGAVPVLLRIINRNPGEHGGAVQLLWELSRCEAGKAAILAEPLSVVTIASALTQCTGDQRKLLNDLCQGNPRVVIEVAHAGVFGPLVTMLHPGMLLCSVLYVTFIQD